MEQKFDYVLFEGLLRVKSDTVTNVDQLFSILNQRNQLNILSWIWVFFTCFVTRQYRQIPCKVAL